MARIMAIDLGDKRIGIAVSDPSKTLAQPLCTLHWGDRHVPDCAAAVRRVVELCEEYEVEVLVVGFPRHMDGSVGERAEQALKWKARLETAASCPVQLEDERLTSRIAERVLIEGDVRRADRKAKIDPMAAALILDTYLRRRCDGPDSRV